MTICLYVYDSMSVAICETCRRNDMNINNKQIKKKNLCRKYKTKNEMNKWGWAK